MSDDRIIRPQPGPQTDFLKADQKIVFYGGGARMPLAPR